MANSEPKTVQIPSELHQRIRIAIATGAVGAKTILEFVTGALEESLPAAFKKKGVKTNGR